jgi:hypothetical protein
MGDSFMDEDVFIIINELFGNKINTGKQEEQ